MTKIQGWKIADQRGQKKNRIPPFAPSAKELAVYRKYLARAAKNDNLPKKALTLGATPELRDGAINAGLESIAVDVSQKMMDKFSDLMEEKNNPLDIKMLGNWLTMDFSAKSFGAVMGDASLNNLVTKKDNEKIVKLSAALLPRGGYLILRNVFFPDSLKGYGNAQRLVNDFHYKKISWEDFFMELRFNIFRRQAYNKKTFQYDAGKTFKLIDSLEKKGIITAEELEKINVFRNKVINTVYPDKEFIKMAARQGFKLVETLHDRPHRFFKYLYLVVFEKI
jgi:hypothetical protein